MVPMDRATFMGELEAFYTRRDALLHTPQVKHDTHTLRHFSVFLT